MYGLTDIFGILMLAGALAASASVSRSDERVAAIICCTFMIVDFTVYELSWNAKTNIAIWATSHGFPIRTCEIWSFMDMICGLVCLTEGYKFRWGWALFASFLTETVCNYLHFRLHVIDSQWNNSILTYTFWLQCAVLIQIGAGGLYDFFRRIAYSISRRWNIFPIRRSLATNQSVIRAIP